MAKLSWQVKTGIALVLSSLIVYIIHFVMFHDSHHILIYLFGDLGFLPLEVLLVSLIIHRLLSERERKARLVKLNMVIGAFFSETGYHLLTYFSDHDPGLDEIREILLIRADWDDETFDEVSKRLMEYPYSLNPDEIDLKQITEYLLEKRNSLLRLLENPNLLEHESFTDLLMAVFHLTEELEARIGQPKLPDTDLKHLTGDMERSYRHLVLKWISYMQHLKREYAYLFSLAMRTNPFDETAKVIVR
ncbi:hypothetical protein ACFLRF_01615 [Candidatus Altiarchaeota archaeon]